jgi:hypothetical protein
MAISCWSKVMDAVLVHLEDQSILIMRTIIEACNKKNYKPYKMILIINYIYSLYFKSKLI